MTGLNVDTDKLQEIAELHKISRIISGLKTTKLLPPKQVGSLRGKLINKMLFCNTASSSASSHPPPSTVSTAHCTYNPLGGQVLLPAGDHGAVLQYMFQIIVLVTNEM